MDNAIDLFINPGEYEFADSNFCLRTTLGSCVSIALWHPRRRLGGLCHFMLPGRRHKSEQALDGRYGEEAFELLLMEVGKADTRLEDYEVKLFGGANMFAQRKTAHRHVGRSNIEFAQRLLNQRGVRVISQSLGGYGYRNLIFDIARGIVWVRHVGHGGEVRNARTQ